MNLLVGLGYKPGVGKSAIASHMVRELGFTRLSIAFFLKKIASDILDQDTFSPEFKSELIVRSNGREFLQRLADFLQAELGADFLIVHKLNLREALSRHSLVVIDDVRRPSEVNYIHSLGGCCFNVQRAHRESDNGELTWHASTAAWDRTIENNSTVANAAAEVFNLAQDLCGRSTLTSSPEFEPGL